LSSSSNNNNSNYNWKKECEKSIHSLILYLIPISIFSIDLKKIKSDIDRFRTSLPSILENDKILDFDNDDVKGQEGVADSII